MPLLGRGLRTGGVHGPASVNRAVVEQDSLFLAVRLFDQNAGHDQARVGVGRILLKNVARGSFGFRQPAGVIERLREGKLRLRVLAVNAEGGPEAVDRGVVISGFGGPLPGVEVALGFLLAFVSIDLHKHQVEENEPDDDENNGCKRSVEGRRRSMSITHLIVS